MDVASIYYLGVTMFLFAVFVCIVARVCSSRRRDEVESPKFRMMDDD